ncbi:MAG: FkbM family methyltransferase [Cocleimonas sp.]
MINFRKILKSALRNKGFDISRYSSTTHPLARRKKLIETYDINLVLDVGANIGQYVKEMRSDIHYSKEIISFEPLKKEFEILNSKAAIDDKWLAYNWALGDSDEKSEINIAGNSYSSSLLSMLDSHENSAPESKYVGKETIEVRTLDKLMEELSITAKNIYLKIDTQGFESRVIKGAEQSLELINTLQLEMSLVQLYEDELSFQDMYSLLLSKGYTLVAIEPGFSDAQTGQLLQVDGIFHRY